MHQDSALITFILDESGSMGAIEHAARTGFNEFLDEQLTHGGDTWWTLTTFNTSTRTRFAVIPGAEVRPLGSDYSPGGMTALYDAVGSAVTETRRYLEDAGDGAPADVIVVILTDGLENASREWTHAQVFDLITEAEDSGWQFIFLGANQDSWATSQSMGIRKGAVVDWAPDPVSHDRAMDEMKLAAAAYRTSKVQQTRYRDRRHR